MTSTMSTRNSTKLAELANNKGDEAFISEDYVVALSLYSSAIKLDPTQYIYPLNRALVNLKLTKWVNAELDATRTLEIMPTNVKAFYRRAVARVELRELDFALQDLRQFVEHGGSPVEADHLRSAITGRMNALNDTQRITGDDANVLLYDLPPILAVKESEMTSGLGLFARIPFRRGDLILSEHAMLSSPILITEQLEANLRDLSPKNCAIFLELHNAHVDCTCFLGDILCGTFSTNSFAIHNDQAAIFPIASRINHSCTPNAKQSLEEGSGYIRVFALTDIEPGAEIFISYLDGRQVYGNSTKSRQALLQHRHFTCMCTTCSLPTTQASISDARRRRLGALWQILPRFSPKQPTQRMTTIIEGIELLKEEGFFSDAVDFTKDAAFVCAFHQDWRSAKHWATLSYDIVVAEFGKDSVTAEELREGSLNPMLLPLAGLGPRKTFGGYLRDYP